MGDATKETFELEEEGPVDSQEPLTAGYKNEKDNYIRDPEKDKKKDIRSFCLSVFNLMNAILGSGILGLADTMNNLGVILFYVLLLITALLAGYTINLLLITSKHSGEKSFEGLAVRAYGRPGKVLTSIMIVFHCLGAMVSYVFIIKKEMPELVKVLINPDDAKTSPNDPWYIQGWFLMLIVVLFVIVPLSSLKNIRFLGYSSAFGMFCMLLFTFTVVYEKFVIPCPFEEPHNASVALTLNDTEETPKEDVEPLEEQECEAKLFRLTSKSAYAVPTMIFAFMCHASMLPIYQELRRPNPRKMRKVAGVSISLVFTIYTLCASFGYFTFFNRVKSELLLTYSDAIPTDPLIILSRIMVLICVTLSTPLLHYPCRKTIVTTFLPNPQIFSWFRHLGVMVGIITTCVLLVLYIPNIRDIFGLAGATSSTSLLIILPCVFFLKLADREKVGRVTFAKVFVLMVFGIVFMIASVILIIYDWAT